MFHSVSLHLCVFLPLVTVALADDEAGVRRDAMLASMVEAPYPPTGAWRHEDFALAAYWLNRRTADADRGLLAIAKDEFPKLVRGSDFHWHAYLLERTIGPISAARTAGRA